MAYFGVITEVPTPESGGNMAAAVGPYYEKDQPASEETGWMTTYKEVPLEKQAVVALRWVEPVFKLGEILVLDDGTGREIGGDGRKPSKWFVTCEEFQTLPDAVRRSREVTT